MGDRKLGGGMLAKVQSEHVLCSAVGTTSVCFVGSGNTCAHRRRQSTCVAIVWARDRELCIDQKYRRQVFKAHMFGANEAADPCI